jgi:hypothetical protein
MVGVRGKLYGESEYLKDSHGNFVVLERAKVKIELRKEGWGWRNYLKEPLYLW